MAVHGAVPWKTAYEELAEGPGRLRSGCLYAVHSQAAPEIGYIQVVESTLSSGSYADIRVTAGIPVRWITHADEDEINGCNNRMLCRDLGLELTFTPGENLLEFTANTPGVYAYSC